MPFDALTMAAVADELETAVIGGQIQRIIQPSLHSVGISMYGSGKQHWLIASADARHARIHLSDGKLAKAFPTPSSFVMTLRKYLEGGRLRSVRQPRYERVLRLTCTSKENEFVLVVEVMGKHSNLMLLDSDDKILGALKLVPPRQSRLRPILPGHTYSSPPAHDRNGVLFGVGPRISPLDQPDDFLQVLQTAPSTTMIRDALLGLLPGAGPFLCDQIALRSGKQPLDPLAHSDAGALALAAREVLSPFETHMWIPSTFNDERGRPDFAAFEPLGVDNVSLAPSMSEAIEQTTGQEETRDVLSTVRKTVLDEIERARRAVGGRLHSLEEGLVSAADADAVMERGQLLLAYAYGVSKGARELEIPELEIRIPLEPLLSPAENAERLFKRYRKLKDAQRRIPAMMEIATKELERIDELAAFAWMATSEADLRALQPELHPEIEVPVKRSKNNKRRGPPHYQFNDWTAVVGRTARENDEVTFRVARRDDLWLHARGRTGAHVVLQGTTRDVSDDVLFAAAALAAYFSEGRSDTAVDVDVAAVRDVRKTPGGPPGRVTYRDARTVRVQPGLEGWVKVRG